MIKKLLHLEKNRGSTLQAQIFEQISAAIMSGQILIDKPLPSSRSLAKQLGISRNTVILAYDRLVFNGYLMVKARRGYFVDPNIIGNKIKEVERELYIEESDQDWDDLLQIRSRLPFNAPGPGDPHAYEYPFVCGQFDPGLFPVENWRECCRYSQYMSSISSWAADHHVGDEPHLIEQIQSRILPRRGIWAVPKQILITLGAQQSLYLALRLLLARNRTLGVEDPGCLAVREIARLIGAKIRGLPVDSSGLIADEVLAGCNLVYTTPSCQSPTTVTMSLERRLDLLNTASEENLLIIEDDSENERNFEDYPTPALKSLDEHSRIIYLGSFSKVLAPGLRIGFVVGPREFIKEARALRFLNVRHPPTNNQHTIAQFIARGFYDASRAIVIRAYKERWSEMGRALDKYLPESYQARSHGGSSYWVRGPDGLNSNDLADTARENGILIEPADAYFCSDDPPLNYFRLGFSTIAADKIAPGIGRLSSLCGLGEVMR